MWLEVGPTNNNPQVIALYFVKTLLQYRTVPCLLRCDRGTEIVHLEKIQKFLRRNETTCSQLETVLFMAAAQLIKALSLGGPFCVDSA